MKTIAVIITALLCASSASAQTLAYWRFEDATIDRQILPTTLIADESGNGNALRTFTEETAPQFIEAAPAPTVPQTGQPNRFALDNSRRPATRRMQTRDVFVTHNGGGVDLNTWAPDKWTIEASILLKPVENWQTRWQTFVGRDGYNIPNRPANEEDRLAALGFKKRGDDNKLSIEVFDSAGNYVVVRSIEPMRADEWYHVAAVGDGKTLTLYIKSAADERYVRQGDAPFAGALAAGGEGWTVGRGSFAYNPSEQFLGLIDEVRITAAALTPEHFLASPPARNALDQGAIATSLPAPLQRVARAVPPMPKNLVHAHDPAMIQAGEWYHVFASHNGLSHWRSKDLATWEKLPALFTAPPEWAVKDIDRSPGLWAPDIAQFGGRFNLYYSASRFGSQRSAIGLITNQTLDPSAPDYKWVDRGKVIESFPRMDYNTIDPAITLDADGRPWLAFGSFNKGIYLVGIDPETGMLSATDKTIHHLAARPGNTAIEAPHVFFHGGWYYLIVSNDFCCRGERSTYKLMVGRSRQITGPYVDREGGAMVDGHASLLVRGYEYHRGPGHSSIIRHGDEELLAHHYYDGRANGIPTLAIRPLYWDVDGWPLVGEPIAERGAASDRSLEGSWLVFIDDSKPRSVQMNADGSVAGDDELSRWKFGGAQLELIQAAGGSAECFVARDRNSFVGRRTDGAIIRGIRSE